MSAMLSDARPDEATAVVETSRPERKRVVIVVGGFAGLAAANALRHAEAEVVLIDRRNHHIFQPLRSGWLSLLYASVCLSGRA
jgi:NADH:ubiquinone reductase (H+-translocating)